MPLIHFTRLSRWQKKWLSMQSSSMLNKRMSHRHTAAMEAEEDVIVIEDDTPQQWNFFK